MTKKYPADYFDSFYYLNMTELKQACKKLGIPLTKGKGQMIDAIKQLITKGTIPVTKKMPAISKAQKGQSYPLAKDTPILYGSYKNDAKTRAFFKKLIGEYFHFTAFGIDWINERWYMGTPPTYQEYADMWQREYEKRRQEKPQPKKEWALINFMQRYHEQFPQNSAAQARKAWRELREEKVKEALIILEQLLPE